MKTLYNIINEYVNGAPGLRLGQYFCNKYIKDSWPELYYAKYDHAVELIRIWLRNNDYTNTMPEPKSINTKKHKGGRNE